MPDEFDSLQPPEILAELDKWIVGQHEAKKAVAVAMRNRWRRRQVAPDLQKEIVPKNILMIGPTGVGKTEVARRMAKLTHSPFIKVEATKYTEVGFKGSDVDTIIKDILDIAIKLVRERESKRLEPVITEKVNQRLLSIIIGDSMEGISSREAMLHLLQTGQLELVELDYEPRPAPRKGFPAFLSPFAPNRGMESNGGTAAVLYLDAFNGDREKPKSKCTVKEIRAFEEADIKQKLLVEENIIKRAIYETEEFGIVFIDELDKIVSTGTKWSADASDEGVQRDLLPLIEGTKIQTDHGDVDTSKILFIGSGAFMQAKPSDLLAELQGRLPIRVKLSDLSEEDLYRILVEPECNLILQQKALMKTEGVDLRFTDEAILEIARAAAEANKTVENIGARRLQTVLEKVLEDVSYNAAVHKDTTVVFDKADIELHFKEFRDKVNLKHYIL